MHDESWSFDVDVDLAPFLGGTRPLLVSSRWYELLATRHDRPESRQRKIEEIFRNVVLRAQWQARAGRTERRRALRAPLVARVDVSRGSRLVATDISAAGLRCSGRPSSGLVEIEFKLPGLAFPIATRAEVTSYRDRPVVPLVGLRFVDIERPYVEQIVRYVDTRRRALYAA